MIDPEKLRYASNTGPGTELLCNACEHHPDHCGHVVLDPETLDQKCSGFNMVNLDELMFGGG